MAGVISDLAIAKELQAQFDLENVQDAHDEVVEFLPVAFRTPSKHHQSKIPKGPQASLVAPEWEDIDPTPDLHALFLQFNDRFFWSRLGGCEVKWSPRMTLCAGVCSYQKRAGYCSIRLSVPLLKLRPRSDLVETLLHEMIHAYLFITDGNDDHDGHGPAFHEHMYRINKEAGTKISVYHNFHDEVALYKTHWWKCDGPCQNWKPFYGMVKRSMNRAPGPNDNWYADHQSKCGGNFIKVKEPEDYGKKKPSKRKLSMDKSAQNSKDIRGFFGTGVAKDKKSNGGARGNIHGFGGTSFGGPSGLQTKGRTGTIAVNPGKKQPEDNSNPGHVITPESHLASTSGGRALGGAPVRAANAQSAVRDAWSKMFNVSSKAEQPKKEESNVSCPVCDKIVPEKNINSHLDECLTLSSS